MSHIVGNSKAILIKLFQLNVFPPPVEEPRHDFHVRGISLNVPSLRVFDHSLISLIDYFLYPAIDLVLSVSLRPHEVFQIIDFSFGFPVVHSHMPRIIVLVTQRQLIVLFFPPVESYPDFPVGHFSDNSLHFFMTRYAKESHLLILVESLFRIPFKYMSHNNS